MSYLAGAAIAVILLNANSGVGELAIAIWAVASVLLGWGTGTRLRVPGPPGDSLGYPHHYQHSEPILIRWSAMFCAFISTARFSPARS